MSNLHSATADHFMTLKILSVYMLANAGEYAILMNAVVAVHSNP